MTDRTLERLAREERQNELCRLRSDNARLRLALDAAKSEAAVSAAEERDAKECLSIANDGLPMDMGLWAMLKRQRDGAVVGLRDLYCEHAGLLALSRQTPGAAYENTGKLLKELEPESKPDA